MSLKNLRTWIIVDTSCLKNNYNYFRKLLGPKAGIMAIAKSNAYGHSLVDYAKTVVKLGVNFLGVDSITEALTLRRHKLKIPILVLGYTLPDNFRAAVKYNISLTISGWENLEYLKKPATDGNKLNTHIKIDTGMHRQGFQIDELPLIVKALKQLTSIINIEGVYTHFASAKDPNDTKQTLGQISKFETAVKLFKDAGFKPLVHASASGGVLVYPQARYDLVRIGAAMYGLWPSEETKKALSKSTDLQPALSWKTIISEIKEIARGESLGYDSSETVKRQTKVGICPIGYWHGLPRALSSKGHVLVKGQMAKILGRVCMDMISIDLTDISGAKVF
ncbi:MAG: alanine racemase [Patescibacteria group bacterium]|nr:alanine racemase [Patescibacteria group bacterium]